MLFVAKFSIKPHYHQTRPTQILMTTVKNRENSNFESTGVNWQQLFDSISAVFAMASNQPLQWQSIPTPSDIPLSHIKCVSLRTESLFAVTTRHVAEWISTRYQQCSIVNHYCSNCKHTNSLSLYFSKIGQIN